MRRSVRTTVLASSAAAAVAFGAIGLAPIASAEPEVPAAPLGSSSAAAPDLVVSVAALCVDKTDKKPEDGKVAALKIDIKNAGKGDASNVATNYVVLPDAPGVANEKVIKAGEGVSYTIPSRDAVWQSRPGGAAVFSPQLDGNYPDNIAFGLLSVNCEPVVAPK